jgi:dCMP deaminase
MISNNPERISIDEAYMQMAEVWSNRSYATRKKVGAILVNDKQIISDGYNGMPSGFPNEEVESINDEGELSTNPLTLHGESNAILKCAAAGIRARGSTLYVTISPCFECSKLIIQSGIIRVVYREDYRLLDGLDNLHRANIEVMKLERIMEN